MSELREQIGARVAQLRKNAGFTQADLAEAADLSKDFISRLERGNTGVSVESLDAIARCMGIPLRELFSFEGDKEAVAVVESATVKLRLPDGTLRETVLEMRGAQNS